MGEVYLGEHPDIGRKVAIKVLISSLSKDREMSERFVAEARAVNKINHPNIIQIFDFGTLPDERLYYTMEHLDGRELTDIIKNEAPLTLARATNILSQITAALDAAHAVGIVHRDLKPDNIFVCKGPTGEIVKVLDFGIAKLLGPGLGSQHKTTTGMIMGTPMYMSPEQASGDIDNITPRSDIYAMGIIAYELLSGAQPFQAPSVALLLAKHITEPPIPLAQTTKGLPSSVCSAVETALIKNPQQRYPTAGDFFRAYSAAAAEAPGNTMARPVNPNPFSSSAGGAGTGPAAGSGPYPPPGSYISGPHVPGAYQSGNQQAQSQVKSLGASLVNPPKNSALIYAVIALLALLVLGGGGLLTYRFLFAESSDKKEEKDQARQEPSRDLAEGVEKTGSDEEKKEGETGGEITIYSINVSSNTPGIQVNANIGGQATLTKTPPFTLEVGPGERIVLTAQREGFKPSTETFIATENKKVVFNLEEEERAEKSSGRRRPPRKKPTSIRPKTQIREGTLKMD